MNDRMRVAIDVLEYARNDLLQDRPFTPGRQVAELTTLGLYFKIAAGLESVITLVEKGLPTFAINREMLEALISMAYIAVSDSVARAEMYRDYLHVMRWKSADERSRTRGLEDTVSAADLKKLEDEKAAITTRRGSKVVEDMQNPRKWKTWAGDISVRKMMWAAGMTETTYILGYSWPSQAVHAHDADRYFKISDEGIVHPSLPPRPEGALLPAASIVLVSMEVINGFLGLGKIDAIRQIKARIDALVADATRK